LPHTVTMMISRGPIRLHRERCVTALSALI
jgi:hypothetical protein